MKWGVEHFVRVKECYPPYLLLSRTKEGSIFTPEKEAGKYEEAKSGFIQSYRKNVWLRKSLEIVNETVKIPQQSWGDSRQSMQNGKCNNHKGSNIARLCTHVCVDSVKGKCVKSNGGRIKGKSALMIFDRHLEYCEKYNRHFGARGYCCKTVGNVNKETIKRYIGKQYEKGMYGRRFWEATESRFYATTSNKIMIY